MSTVQPSILAAPAPEPAPAPCLVWLGDPAADDPALVGGKAGQLSRLARRYRVPPGFCLTAARDDLDLTPLADAYRRLGELLDQDDPPVAVRSSGVDEDGANASFAGQLETVLGVRGLDQVAGAVDRCRKSAHLARALEYRRAQGLSSVPGTAVLVQALVAADVSLVAFSANPVTGARDEVVVNASWGLGESIVGGTTTPDSLIVRGNEVVERRIGSKERMTVLVPGGTREVPVPRMMRETAALGDVQALEVADLARRLERENGWPVDIECALQGSGLYLLQCRPITSLGAIPGQPGRERP